MDNTNILILNKNMKPLYKFKIGSSIFFSEYSDYKIKDIDWVAIFDIFPFENKKMMKVKIGNDDIFMYKPNISKQDFIDELYSTNVIMKVGKFLSSEFCKHFNITIEDLKSLEQFFDKLDDKHKYEKLIYKAYIENNDFVLTQEQRDKAYQEYKKYREQ